MTAVLRVDGENIDVSALPSWLPNNLPVERVWRAGETALGGRILTTSGFSVLLSEAEGSSLAAEAAGAFSEMAENIGRLVAGGARAEVDFALFVDPRRPSTLVVSVQLLRERGKQGVALLVSAYPTTGEDE